MRQASTSLRLRAVRSSRARATRPRSTAGSWPHRCARRRAAARAGQAGSERARPARLTPRTRVITCVAAVASVACCAELGAAPDRDGGAVGG